MILVGRKVIGAHREVIGAHRKVIVGKKPEIEAAGRVRGPRQEVPGGERSARRAGGELGTVRRDEGGLPEEVLGVVCSALAARRQVGEGAQKLLSPSKSVGYQTRGGRSSAPSSGVAAL